MLHCRAKYAPVEHPTLHIPVPAQPQLRCGRIPFKVGCTFLRSLQAHQMLLWRPAHQFLLLMRFCGCPSNVLVPQDFDLRPIFAQPPATFTATDLAFPEITPAPLSPPAPDAACVVAIKSEPKLVQEQPQPVAGFFIDGLAMLGALLPTACAPVRRPSPSV